MLGGQAMTTNEILRLHGFWTHKRTGERVSISIVTKFSEAYVSKVDALGNPVGAKEIMLLRDLKEDYVKG